jgi:hypothetical protein
LAIIWLSAFAFIIATAWLADTCLPITETTFGTVYVLRTEILALQGVWITELVFPTRDGVIWVTDLNTVVVLATLTICSITA